MGIFDKLKKSNNDIAQRKSLLEIAREAEEQEKKANNSAQAVSVDDADKSLAFPAVKIRLIPDDGLNVFDSKLGGLPYWDLSVPYPADEEGNPLSLLAQINFDRDKPDDRLPDCGILQFFIADDFSITSKVVYHKEVNYNTRTFEIESLIKSLNIPVMSNEEKFSPVCQVSKLLFERINDTPDTADGHKLFGYPAFCQEDPREVLESKLAEYYDTLLLQIDSDFGGGDNIVIWGDSGVANFFINSNDLKNLDFSRVLYNWDCF